MDSAQIKKYIWYVFWIVFCFGTFFYNAFVKGPKEVKDFYITIKKQSFWITVANVRQNRDYYIYGTDSNGKRQEITVGVSYDLPELLPGDIVYKHSGHYAIYVQKKDTLMTIPFMVNIENDEKLY